MRFDVGHIIANEQPRQHVIGECPCHTHLLPWRKPEIVGNADVDAAGVILNREALLKGAGAERA